MVSGFGRFSVKEKKERKGRNPATGDDMMLEPRKVVTFKRPGVVHMLLWPDPHSYITPKFKTEAKHVYSDDLIFKH